MFKFIYECVKHSWFYIVLVFSTILFIVGIAYLTSHDMKEITHEQYMELRQLCIDNNKEHHYNYFLRNGGISEFQMQSLINDINNDKKYKKYEIDTHKQ